jgi:hypothetical protein
MAQLPSAASESGNSSPASAAAAARSSVTRLDRQRGVVHIDGTDAIQPRERNDNFVTAFAGSPAAQPVLPPCGTIGTALGAATHDSRDFRSRSRPRHRTCGHDSGRASR